MRRQKTQSHKEGHNRVQGNGFTLIEMLVVIAIIAILAAILFPVFARARESARRASCMSNLKQIGLGTMMYTQDYDEHYPSAWVPGIANWTELVQPYIKSEQVFVCPSGQGTLLLKGNYGASRQALPTPPDSISLASFEAASKTYMYFDSGAYILSAHEVLRPHNAYWYMPGTADISSPTSQPSSDFQNDFKNGRHFHGINMCFADGHVKWLKIDKVYEEAKKWGGSDTWHDVPSTIKPNAWDPADPD